ncbi:MAG: inositol monophosphatase family protein [Promethearchaeota archaeon]
MIPSNDELLNVLKTIVLAGGLCLNVFRGKVENIPKKSDLPPDKVQVSSTAHTKLDDLGQELGLEILRSHFPDVSINVEENTGRNRLFSKNKTGLCFHFDPLDGTYAYTKGRDDFAIGAAFSHNLEFIASSIYFPALDRLYLAARGKGVQIQNSLGQKIAFHRPEKPAAMFLQKRCENLLPIVHKMDLEELNLMSAHHAVVAIVEGRAQVQMYHMASPHDFGIPQVLLEEAGGVCSDIKGGPIQYDTDFSRLPYFLSFFDSKTKKEFFEILNKINP